MPTIADILAQAENPEFVRVATARVLLRQDLAAEQEELARQLKQAMRDDGLENREPLAPVISAQIEELEERIEAEKVPFKFRAIGRRAWADLLANHPPSLVQMQAHQRIDEKFRLDHNPETFPIAAIAASSLEPKMTEDDVQRLDKALNETQFSLLWMACLDANKGLEAPKSVAAGLILRVKRKSGASAADTGSLDQSSLDDESSLEPVS